MSEPNSKLFRDDPAAYYTELGKEAERERIIALLESLNCTANGIEHDCNNDLGDYTPSDLIALIKGENNER